MAAVTFTIEPDELRGLAALAALDQRANGGDGADADAVREARALLDAALSEKLAQAGLPWSPPATAVPRQRAAPDAAPPANPAPALAASPAGAAAPAAAPGARGLTRGTPRRDLTIAATVAAAVVLWGGYTRGWTWTGFQANGQLWDWLSLLLLPMVVGLIPLCLQYQRYIRGKWRAVCAAGIVAWSGFVLAGYLIPIGWTGFRGQTLWNWTGLLLLPGTLAVTAALTSRHVRPARALRSLRPYQKAVCAVLAAGWVVSVIGGYALRWGWTGFPGNTLWDWLQLLILPLVVPTVLLPALLKRITDDVTGQAGHASAPAPATA